MTRVFVAMPFDEGFQEVYEDAVCPAVSGAGLEPFRVDELIGSDRNIIDDIEQGISDSLFVFADLTNQNPNVFYEVGFARAIQKPLVFATQTPESVPFDLRLRRYIKYSTTGRGLNKLRSDLARWFDRTAKAALDASRAPRVTCHGTKFDVPNRHIFWNDLLGQARRRFYLLGRSNKSWIDKSEQQSRELADAIVRIIGNGGEVKILSDSNPGIVETHLRFFGDYVWPLASSRFKELQPFSSLRYAVHKRSNYGAVISDDRLVLLPTLNSSKFRDETLVLEIFGTSLPQFANYLSDIDRMFRSQASQIDIYRWKP